MRASARGRRTSRSESDSEGRLLSTSPLRDTVERTTRTASETVARLNKKVDSIRREWYNRLDPFLYYDHTYKYRLIPELWLTALSGVVFLIATLLMTYVNGIADYRHPGAFRLPDMGHSLVPEITSRPNLPNELLAVSVLSTGILILTHPKRLMVLRRLLVIYSIILVFRSIFVVSTSLPDPSPKCLQQQPYIPYSQPMPLEKSGKENSFWRGVKQTLFPFESTTCGDLIFSGHTVTFMLCSLIWDRYFTGKRSQWPVFLYHIWTILGLLSIISVRFHYTIDVIVAIFVTISVWQRYHIFVDYRQLYVEHDPEIIEISEGGIIKVIETGDYTHLLPRKTSTERRREAANGNKDD